MSMRGRCIIFSAAHGEDGCPAYTNLAAAFSVSTNVRIVRQQNPAPYRAGAASRPPLRPRDGRGGRLAYALPYHLVNVISHYPNIKVVLQDA
jgi:hypothetical protein